MINMKRNFKDEDEKKGYDLYLQLLELYKNQRKYVIDNYLEEYDSLMSKLEETYEGVTYYAMHDTDDDTKGMIDFLEYLNEYHRISDKLKWIVMKSKNML